MKIESHASYLNNRCGYLVVCEPLDTSPASKMGPNDLIEKSIAANSLQVELLEVSL